MTPTEIKKMLEEISDWPWVLIFEDERVKGVNDGTGESGESRGWCTSYTIIETDCGVYPPSETDAKFIAKSPEIISQLLKENEKLKEELNKQSHSAQYRKVLLQQNHITKLLKENEEMRECLAFYANKENWKGLYKMKRTAYAGIYGQTQTYEEIPIKEYKVDFGEKAQNLLTKLEGE